MSPIGWHTGGEMLFVRMAYRWGDAVRSDGRLVGDPEVCSSIGLPHRVRMQYW